MEGNNRAKEILTTKTDVDMFDEYSKYIIVGAISRNGLNSIRENIMADKIFDQALAMVEARKILIKSLKNK